MEEASQKGTTTSLKTTDQGTRLPVPSQVPTRERHDPIRYLELLPNPKEVPDILLNVRVESV